MDRVELYIHVAEEGLRNQQARVDAAKVAASLLAAVGPAVAAASIASTLDQGAWKQWTVAAVVVTFLSALGVFVLDRRDGLDPLHEVASGHGATTGAVHLNVLRDLLDAYETNTVAVRNVYLALYVEALAVGVVVVGACFLLPG